MRVKSILATVHNLHGKSQIICVLGELTDRRLFHTIFLMENFIPASSWALIVCSLSLLERALKLFRATQLRTHPHPCLHCLRLALVWLLPGASDFGSQSYGHHPPGLVRDAHLCPRSAESQASTGGAQRCVLTHYPAKIR